MRQGCCLYIGTLPGSISAVGPSYIALYMTQQTRIEHTGKPRVLIIGGGFAGIELAKALRGAEVQVVVGQHGSGA